MRGDRPHLNKFSNDNNGMKRVKLEWPRGGQVGRGSRRGINKTKDLLTKTLGTY